MQSNSSCPAVSHSISRTCNKAQSTPPGRSENHKILRQGHGKTSQRIFLASAVPVCPPPGWQPSLRNRLRWFSCIGRWRPPCNISGWGRTFRPLRPPQRPPLNSILNILLLSPTTPITFNACSTSSASMKPPSCILVSFRSSTIFATTLYKFACWIWFHNLLSNHLGPKT